MALSPIGHIGKVGAMPRRNVVVAAALVAVVAAAVVWFVVTPGDPGSSLPQGDGSEAFVLRSTAPIAAGVSIEDLQTLGLVEPVAAGSVAVPEFPVLSLESLPGTVTATTIDAGVVLATSMFVSPTASVSGLATRLDDGHTALAVTIDATRAVGGWLRPGDRVNILVPSSCPEPSSVSSQAIADDVEVRCRRVRYLYQSVLVVAVGAEVDPVPVDGGATLPTPGAATLVLSLPPRAAQWVASYDNDLWFTLVPPQFEPRAIGPLPLFIDRLPGEDPVLLTPDCGDPADPVAAQTAVGAQGGICGADPAAGGEP